MFIDTQIWVFAKKKPTPENFSSQEAFQEAVDCHQTCQQFLLKAIEQEQIGMTSHQITEISHAFSFRGLKIPRNQTQAFLQDLELQENIQIIPLQLKDYHLALSASVRSGTHVWDYLWVLPLAPHITRIISCDRHFQHASLRLKGTELINPIKKWFHL